MGRKVAAEILNQLTKEVGMRKWHSGNYLKEMQEKNHMRIWGEELSSRGNSKCKGLEAGMNLTVPARWRVRA